VIIFIICGLTLTLLINSELYTYFSREDRLAEYLSAIVFLITSIFFFLSIPFSFNNKSFKYSVWRTILLTFLGIGFFLVAGEEISWGQRIFNIETPETLKEINDQGELNFHNINKRFFDDLLDRSTILFVFVGLLLLVFNTKRVIGLPSPDIYLICSFAITPFYHQYGVKSLDFHHLIYLFFILMIIFSTYKKNRNHIKVILITILVTLVIRFIHIGLHDNFHLYNNSANEYKEFMFGLCCLFYAYVILSVLKSEANRSHNFIHQ